MYQVPDTSTLVFKRYISLGPSASLKKWRQLCFFFVNTTTWTIICEVFLWEINIYIYIYIYIYIIVDTYHVPSSRYFNSQYSRHTSHLDDQRVWMTMTSTMFFLKHDDVNYNTWSIVVAQHGPNRSSRIAPIKPNRLDQTTLSWSLFNPLTHAPARVSHHLSHSLGGGSQTTHLTVDRNPSATAHPGPSAVVPPHTHRRAAHTAAPGAPPSTWVDSGNSMGVSSGDSTSISDLPEVWSALSSTMHCPDVAAPKMLFIVADEVHAALPERSVTGSHQASYPQTFYLTLIRSGSGCMVARQRLRCRVEAHGTAVVTQCWVARWHLAGRWWDRCWNWCSGYVEIGCWDHCNYIIYVHFVCFYHLIVQFQRLMCWVAMCISKIDVLSCYVHFVCFNHLVV
jgi:hypothetical protein